MNVLHILAYSIPNLSGYTIRSKYIVETQNRIGLAPCVVTSPKYRHETPFLPQTTIEGIQYFRTTEGFLKPLPYVGEYSVISSTANRAIEVSRERNISVIHAHSPSLNGLAGVRAARRLGIPLVYEMRALWEEAAVESGKFGKNSLKYALSKYLEDRLFRQADLIVTISSHLKENLLARGIPEEKIRIVPNGVETETFSPAERDENLADKYRLRDKTVIGYIGSFFKFEGLTYLVRAFAEIVKINENARLMLVGDGEDMAEIRSLVDALGLQKSAVITGRVPHNEVLSYYSIMDIMVYPRIRSKLTEEVTPLKPLEAMSLEKAVVASDVGGLRELIKDGRTGLLFKAEDIGDLAKKCLRFIESAEARSEIAKNARLDMIQNRDWIKIGSNYLDIYKQAVSNIR